MFKNEVYVYRRFICVSWRGHVASSFLWAYANTFRIYSHMCVRVNINKCIISTLDVSTHGKHSPFMPYILFFIVLACAQVVHTTHTYTHVA